MSPEQAMGLVDQLDGRADLFSVGAMMHALITGHRINNGRTEQEALVMAATKPVPSVARLAAHLPIELIKSIDKSLAWDRRNRFQDAREMQQALIELMPAQTVMALPGRAPPRPNEVVAPPPPANLAGMQHQLPPDPGAGLPPALGSTGPMPTAQAIQVPVGPPGTHPQMPPVVKPSIQMGAVSMPAQSPAGPPPPAFDPLIGYMPAAPAPAAAQQPAAPGASPDIPENDRACKPCAIS